MSERLPAGPKGPAAGDVLVLHGWGMPAWSVRPWCRALRRAGFGARPFAYRSLTATLDANAQALAAVIEALPGPGPVHLVGHSMGGLLILHTLARHPVRRLGRVVLVGTPFQGSAVAEHLHAWRVGRWLLGRSIVQWRPLPAAALQPGLSLCTLAGTRPMGLGRLIARLSPPHDGTVTVAETQVPFATDHRVLPVTHTQMLLSTAVMAEVLQFLQHGTFSPVRPADPPV